MFESTERPGVEESYQTASNTSNLTVEADRRGAGDMLIAAGWSPTRLGMALLRLHSEWDASERKRQEKPQPWTESELRMMANNLKSRPQVWAQLAPWLALKGIDAEKGAAALLHWVNPTCPHCVKGLRKIAGAPSLSARQCSRCHGTGQRPHPQGTAKVLVYLDEAVSMARHSIRKRLRNTNN